jgi:hypothetical protein
MVFMFLNYEELHLILEQIMSFIGWVGSHAEQSRLLEC